MKKLIFLFSLVCGTLSAQVGPPPATAAEVVAGTDSYKYLTPKNLADAGIATGSPLSVGATVEIARTNAAYYTTNNQPVFHVRRFGAVPKEGVDNVAAIQAAIDAASLVGTESIRARVQFDAGSYGLNPDNAVYPTLTSEGHPNVLVLISNNVELVGNNTRLYLLNGRQSGSVIVNVFGSGGGTAGDPTTYGTTNVVLRGIEIDGMGFNCECTQIMYARSWLIEDCITRNSGYQKDGWDVTGSYILFKNISAFDCSGNAFGVQTFADNTMLVDGLTVKRAGVAGGTSSAFQFIGGVIMNNVHATDCNILLAPGSVCDFRNSYLHSTNSLTTETNFVFSGAAIGRFNNVTIDVDGTGVGQIIQVSGGGLVANRLRMENYRPAILMTSGGIELRNCEIGRSGAQRPLVTYGGTVTLINSYFNGNSAHRDIRLESGTANNPVIIGNTFAGTGGGAYIEGGLTGLRFIDNYCANGARFNASGDVFDNYFGGSFTASGFGGPILVLKGNTFAGSVTRADSSSPLWLGGNIFQTASTAELQKNLLSYTSVTPAASQTLWTNTTAYPCVLYYYGGTITGIGLNGTQVGSGAGNMLVNVGSWAGITNSDTTGHVIRYRYQ